MSYEEIENKLKELYRKKQQLEYDLKYLMTRQGYPNTEYKDGYSIMKELEDVEKQIHDLNLQLRNIPRVIKCVKVKGNIVGRYEYKFPEFNIKLYEGNKWGCPQDLETGFRSEVITDKDNIPIMIRRYLRNSDTKGYLLCYEYPIELDVKPNPEEIKPKREVKEERKAFSRADMIPEQTKYVNDLTVKITCPRCKLTMEKAYFLKTSNLITQQCCPNCGLPMVEWEKYKQQVKSKDQNKKGMLHKLRSK